MQQWVDDYARNAPPLVVRRIPLLYVLLVIALLLASTGLYIASQDAALAKHAVRTNATLIATAANGSSIEVRFTPKGGDEVTTEIPTQRGLDAGITTVPIDYNAERPTSAKLAAQYADDNGGMPGLGVGIPSLIVLLFTVWFLWRWHGARRKRA